MDFNPEILQNLLSQELQYDRVLTDVSNEEISVADARIYSLMQSLFKKWEPADSSTLENTAIAGFKAANTGCTWQFADVSSVNRPILETARDLMYGYINSGLCQSCVLTLDESLQVGRAGPGASCKTKATDFYNKMFCGPLSTTSIELYRHYTNGLSTSWLSAERLRARRFQVDVVAGSNLSSVPKNIETNRTICTEPSLNMFYQLGAGKILERVLKKFHGVDLSLQPEINKELARLGSIDGSFATIDLSKASDTISLSLVQYLLPPIAFRTLIDLRSSRTIYKDEEIELNMISSMGNGFTFPLQTLIFATLVRATYLHKGIIPRVGTMRNYSVFGDDIICSNRVYNDVISVLNDCGFTVNIQKSYNTGSFRESCGGDFFKGHDIRGVYIRKASNAGEIYSIFNRLMRWSCKSGIFITSSLQYVKGLVDFRPVPLHAGDTEGIKVPRDHAGHLKSDKNGAVFYRPLSARTRSRRVNDSDSNFNPNGAIIALIGGYIREQKVSLRLRETTFKVVRRKSPCWDFFTDPGFTIRDYQLIFQELLDHV
jgi:hypothetical protein